MKQSETDYRDTLHTHPDKELERFVLCNIVEKYAAGKRVSILFYDPGADNGIVLRFLSCNHQGSPWIGSPNLRSGFLCWS
jgi:hypothetical protein